MQHSLESFVGLDHGISPQDGATGATNGGEVDMAMWEECTFLLITGTISGTVAMKIQGSDTSGGTFADITGWAITTLAATADDETHALRIRAAATSKRFLRAVVTITGGTASFIALANLPSGPKNADATFGNWTTAGNPSAS